MNKGDKVFIDRIDAVLGIAGTMNPKNPADIRAIAGNLPLVVGACKAIHNAVLSWRCDDPRGVDMFLKDAEKYADRMKEKS